MPTASGWLTAVLSIATFVAGQVFTLQELVIFGVIGMLLVVFSLLAVRIFSPRSRCRRTVSPAVIPALEAARVELNFSPLKWRPWTLPVSGTDSIVTQTPSGETENFQISFVTNSGNILYDFRPTKRGVAHFGSLSLSSLDPFALAKHKWTERDSKELLVLPNLEDVIAPQPNISSKTWQDDYCSAWQGASSGDFHALREYAPGDDLRHVHWKSSARLGELLIRQSEHQWEVGISVVLDNRLGASSPEEFERIVGATASLISACHANSLPVWLYFLASGEDTNLKSEILVEDAPTYRVALLRLASVIQESQVNSLIRPKGLVIALTGSEEDRIEANHIVPDHIAEDEATNLAELVWICFGKGQTSGLVAVFGDQNSSSTSSRSNIDTLWIPTEQSFGEVWNSYMGVSAIASHRHKVART